MSIFPFCEVLAIMLYDIFVVVVVVDFSYVLPSCMLFYLLNQAFMLL